MSVRGFNTGYGIEQYDYNALDNRPTITNTRVKGDAEAEYRSGDVNITKANIGLGNVDNTKDVDKPISTATQAALDEIAADVSDLNSRISSAFIENTASGAIASFSDGADNVPVKELVFGIEAVQSGSGDSAPDNIRPITGWTGLTGGRCGKNILNGVYTAESIDSNGVITPSSSSRLSGFIPVTGKPMILSAKHIEGSSYNGIRVIVYDSNRNFIKRSLWTTVSDGYTTASMNATYFSGVAFIRVQMLVSSEEIDTLQLEYGTSRTDYEAPGTPITADWSSVVPGGIVYGGNFNPTTGVLTVTHHMIDASSLSWAQGPTSTRYRKAFNTTTGGVPDKAYGAANLICNAYTTVSVFGIDYSITGSSGSEIVTIQDPRFENDVSGFRNSLSGVLICYELASPQTYQLTQQQIATLKGTNNIWCDTGDTTVTYRADPKLYIEQLTKPTEDDMTADYAISAGTFFMLGNSLYLATSQIAAGGTITPGTNATQLSLADALNQLNT